MGDEEQKGKKFESENKGKTKISRGKRNTRREVDEGQERLIV